MNNSQYDKQYTAEHIWVQLQEGDILLVGITPYAGVTGNLEALQRTDKIDIMPPYSTLCSVETNKCIYEIQLPFSCKLLAVNQNLLTNNQHLLVTDDWKCKVLPKDEKWKCKLMILDEYKAFIDD